MSHTLTHTEIVSACRAFAAEYPTPNVRRAIALAESGSIAWADAYRVFQSALAAGIASVSS